MSTSPLAMLGVVAATVFGSIGALYLKKASAHIKLHLPSLLTNVPLILGFLFYGISVVFFVSSLKYGELSVLYPIVALGFVWTSLLSKYVLGEKMNTLKWIGIALIILGVSFIGIGSSTF